MAIHDLMKTFDSTKIRVVWDDEKKKYFFSVMDVVQVLTDQPERRLAAKYWSVVKARLKAKGVELPTICSQLKLVAADETYAKIVRLKMVAPDGKRYASFGSFRHQ